MAKKNHDFHEYTDIENINNYPKIIEEGEEVIISEKGHGQSMRSGYVLQSNESGEAEWQFVAGSHHVNRKEYNMMGVRSMFWSAFEIDSTNCPMRKLLQLIKEKENAKISVICFGELLGTQDMKYGFDKPTFRLFDISVDGKYLDYDVYVSYLPITTDGIDLEDNCPSIQTVPSLYRGPFSLQKVAELTDGPQNVCISALAGSFKGREGVVVKPIKERHDPRVGRVILKSVSVDYLDRRNANKEESVE